VGWPSSIAVIGNWTGSKNRGTVIGFWCINVNIGNIIGSQVGGLELINMDLNWGYLLLTVAASEICISLAIISILYPEPEKVGCVIKEYDEQEEKCK